MKFLKRFLGIVISLAILASPLLFLWKLQAIEDWWKLRGYVAPTAVSQLATEDTFNSYTRRVFYVNHPQLLASVNSFRQYCPENEQTIVLGCYHPGQNGIYIYAVQDPTLAGIQQVTAAHEVLHATYARLSTKERNYVNGLLENYYKNDLTDPRVIGEVKIYQQTEPGSVMDEMNSTFGTEIANLPAPLESYYKQFFTNRGAIVAYEQAYEGEFTQRTNQIDADDQQLANLKTQINNQEQSLTTQLAQINTDRARLDQENSSGNITAYNAGVNSFNSEVDAYNAGVATLKTDIANYNQLVDTRNSIASDLRGLDAAIDTRLTTQSAQ